MYKESLYSCLAPKPLTMDSLTALCEPELEVGTELYVSHVLFLLCESMCSPLKTAPVQSHAPSLPEQTRNISNVFKEVLKANVLGHL